MLIYSCQIFLIKEKEMNEIDRLKIIIITSRIAELLYLRDSLLISMDNYKIRFKALLEEYSNIMKGGE